MTRNNPVGGTFSKVDAINDAYSQLRISGLTVNPTPSDLEVALDRLESMAAEWYERSICCGYNFEDTPDPNSDSGVRRGFKQAFATNLAVRLIPDFNKAVPPTLMQQASQSLSNLSARIASDNIQQVAYPHRQPVGSGNRWTRWQRFYQGEQAPTDCSVNQLYVDDVENYVEHFDAYLDSGETVSSAVFTADTGITVVSNTVASPDVSYQIRADSGGIRTLTLVMTTSAGRITTRVITFDVRQRP